MIRARPTTADMVVFVVANLTNAMMVLLFTARAFRVQKWDAPLGLVVCAFGLPLIAAWVVNLLQHRPWWAIALPLPLVLYMFCELLLDYVFKIEFRQTAWIFPYLCLYYLGLLGVTGYSFAMGKWYGCWTLCTYFANLLAGWYSYTRVGHG